MHKFKLIIKRVLLTLFGLVGLSIIIVMSFINIAPQFGAAPEGVHLEKIRSSVNYQNGSFTNLIDTKMDMNMGNIGKAIHEMFNTKNTTPTSPLPVKFEDYSVDYVHPDSMAYVTWFGHSTIFLETEGKRILLDPMFGPEASPVSFFGQRFPYQEPINLDLFTKIDAIILSHDHYDHLDYPSILKLAPHTRQFFVPLGVGAHLKRWGVDSTKITEMDWWETSGFEGLEFTATPARHFSGRGISDRNKTLWASWVIKGEKTNIYFSGDSGYGPHFKEIGKKYGPFDFTMMECGQYNEKWEAIHMMPEHTFQANLDLGGEKMMPIHWGAFKLATHSWFEPPERLLAKAAKNEVQVITPVIGERFSVQGDLPVIRWWKGM